MPDRDQLFHEHNVENKSLEESQVTPAVEKKKTKTTNEARTKQIIDLLTLIWRMGRATFVFVFYIGCICGAVYSFFTTSFLAGIFYILGLMFLRKMLKEIIEEDADWLHIKGL